MVREHIQSQEDRDKYFNQKDLPLFVAVCKGQGDAP